MAQRKEISKQDALDKGRRIATLKGAFFGCLLGSAITLAIVQWPNLDLPDTFLVDELSALSAIETGNITYTFVNRLPDSTVQAIDDAYVVPQPPEAMNYWVRAASFKDKNLAETLRASLLLQNLPAETTSTAVEDQEWHLVSLGPYARQVEAHKTLTQLREQNLQPALVRVSAK